MQKDKIKLYKYFFKQTDKPIVMEAKSRQEADHFLRLLNERTGGNMTVHDILDLRVETLVIGESKKIKKGKTLIWVGKENTKDGWMDKEEYLKIVINNKKQRNEKKEN
jgi:hypothetical protein